MNQGVSWTYNQNHFLVISNSSKTELHGHTMPTMGAGECLIPGLMI